MSKVGPGHPPKSTRFRKGVSGNPHGRPRKERPADSTSAFGVVVDKKLTIDLRTASPARSRSRRRFGTRHIKTRSPAIARASAKF